MWVFLLVTYIVLLTHILIQLLQRVETNGYLPHGSTMSSLLCWLSSVMYQGLYGIFYTVHIMFVTKML